MNNFKEQLEVLNEENLEEGLTDFMFKEIPWAKMAKTAEKFITDKTRSKTWTVKKYPGKGVTYIKPAVVNPIYVFEMEDPDDGTMKYMFGTLDLRGKPKIKYGPYSKEMFENEFRSKMGEPANLPR